MGIVIKPIADRGCHYFFGVANSSANQEAQGTFVIRSGHLASSSAERLRITDAGKIIPTEGLTIPDDKNLNIGDDNDLYIKYSSAHGNNFIVSSNGDIEHHMSSSEKIIKGFQNSGNPYVALYYNNSVRLETTNGGASITGDLSLNADDPTLNFIDTNNNNFRITANTGYLYFVDATANQTRATMNNGGTWSFSGALNPNTNNTYDLGTSSLRWRNLYIGDLQLSNKNSKNDVDGTWGDWTLQEGEDQIYMLNNRSGKKYKIKMEEVS